MQDLEYLYNTSTLAAQAIRLAIGWNGSAGTQALYLATTTNDVGWCSQADNIAGFDLTKIADFYYVNDKGVVVKEIRALTLIHEIIHSFVGLNLDDPEVTVPSLDAFLNSTADHMGATVERQNQIAAQLGLSSNHQVSYFAAGTSSTFASLQLQSISYSDGATIDNARIGDTGVNLIDHTGSVHSARRDLIFGLGGNDIIESGGGRDFVYGGEGIDNIFGGDGDDVLYGDGRAGDGVTGTADFLYGEGGSDTLIGGAGADHIDGGDGFDTVSFADMASVVLDLATPANSSGDLQGDVYLNIEQFSLTAGADFFVGAGANDRVLGGAGNDDLSGGDGDDYMDAGAGDDIIRAGNGADVLIGGAGFDRLRGGAGNDRLRSDQGGDAIYGEAGSDVLIASGALNHLYGDDGAVLGGTLATDGEHDLFVGGGGLTFIHDADGDDTVNLGGDVLSFQIFGGVEQWWMEGGYAAWSPFSSLSVMPFATGNLLIALTTAFIDTVTSNLLQFGLTQTNQLEIFVAGGRIGRIIIEDYQLDLETGAASGNVVVFKSKRDPLRAHASMALAA